MSLAKIKFDYVLLAVFALYLVLIFVAGRGQAEGTSAIMVFAFLCIFRLFSGIDTLGGVRYSYCENRSRVWQLLVAIAVLAAFTFYRATTDGTPLWTAAISIAFATAFFFASISIHTWVITKFKKVGFARPQHLTSSFTSTAHGTCPTGVENEYSTSIWSASTTLTAPPR